MADSLPTKDEAIARLIVGIRTSFMQITGT